MNKRTTSLASIALFATSALFAQSAQAKFVAVFEETERVGFPSVQEIGDGTIDLTDLGAGSSSSVNRSSIAPQRAVTALGANFSSMTFFDDAVITGPSSFGVGPGAFASRVNGNAVVESPSFIGVPRGYISEAPLRNTTSWYHATYSSLGMTPGVYTWTWGSGADADSLTFDIVAPILNASGTPIPDNSILAAELPLPTAEFFPLPVPEPSTWAMMLFGFATLGYAAVRRKGFVRAISG